MFKPTVEYFAIKEPASTQKANMAPPPPALLGNLKIRPLGNIINDKISGDMIFHVESNFDPQSPQLDVF